jgi:hypothetical protein
MRTPRPCACPPERPHSPLYSRECLLAYLPFVPASVTTVSVNAALRDAQVMLTGLQIGVPRSLRVCVPRDVQVRVCLGPRGSQVHLRALMPVPARMLSACLRASETGCCRVCVRTRTGHTWACRGRPRARPALNCNITSSCLTQMTSGFTVL